MTCKGSIRMPIPEFDERGYLPPGQHITTWREFLERFGTNPHRLRLATGLAADFAAVFGFGAVFVAILHTPKQI